MANGAILLSEIETDVGGLIQDTGYDPHLITLAANGFLSELYSNTRTRLMETEDDLFASAGDATVDLSDDFSTMISLSVTVPSPPRNLDKGYMEHGDFVKAYPGYLTYAPNQVTLWTDFAGALRFSQPLNVNHTFHLEYLREPQIMVAPGDTAEIKEVYRELVNKGTLARLMEINEDYEEASQERKNLKPLVTAWIRNESRGNIRTGPVIIRSNRGRASQRGSFSQKDF